MRHPQKAILLGVIVLNFFLAFASLSRGHEWGDDWASYVMQGQSILNGTMDEFVERNTFTIFKSSFQIGPVAYPWGYPLILTPSLLVKGVHPLVLKIPGLVLFAGFLFVLHRWLEKRLPATEALLLVALFGFNPMFVKFLDQLLSDIPFLFAVTLFILLLLDYNRAPKPRKSLVLGAVIFLAFFIRTTGLLLLISLLVQETLHFYLTRAERKTIVVHTAFVILCFSLLTFISTAIFPDGQSAYLEQLKGLTEAKFFNNVRNYFFLFPLFFGSATVWGSIHYLFVALFIIGAWGRRGVDHPLIIFFAVYFVAMLFWPEWQGIRFIFPLLPLYLYFIMQGLQYVIQQIPKNSQIVSLWGVRSLWVILIVAFFFESGSMAYENLKSDRAINGPFDPFSSDVYNYIRAETPPDSVIIFYKPRAMRLFTNRDTLMLTECSRLTLGDYVVLSKKAENSQIPPAEIDQCGLALKNVFENRRFVIYQLPK